MKWSFRQVFGDILPEPVENGCLDTYFQLSLPKPVHLFFV